GGFAKAYFVVYERSGLRAGEICERGGGEVSGVDGPRKGAKAHEAGRWPRAVCDAGVAKDIPSLFNAGIFSAF
ncbi:MAG: hypothetical protein ACJA16_004869, partial [Akkermansiaceae bacterium]